MKVYLTMSALLLVLAFGCSEPSTAVIVKTSLGDIELELYPKQAPLTTANFLRYLDAGAYNGSTFFRTCTPSNEAEREVKIEVIQGGNVHDAALYDSIPLETTLQTKLRHLDGTISMARSTPNSATSSFFICIGDQASLDFNGPRNPDGQGFAAFGRVTKGMDVVKEIQHQADTNQYLLTPVVIYTIERMP